MTLDDEIDISRGDWLVGADEPVPLASSFEADIVWMHETALDPSYPDGDADHAGGGDIEIRYTGLRPGEKLYEELLIGERVEATHHSRIMTASEIALPWEEVEGLVEALFDACLTFDAPRIRELLEQAPLGYQAQSEPVDLVWAQSTQAPGQAPTPASPGDKVVVLRPRPASTLS